MKILAGQIVDILRFTYKNRESSIEYTIKKLKDFDYDIRKDERQKIADQVKALTVNQITYSDTLYKAILKG